MLLSASDKDDDWFLGLNQNQCDILAVLKYIFFPSDIKISFFFYHITISPDAPINCRVFNRVLNRVFLLETIWKESLDFK